MFQLSISTAGAAITLAPANRDRYQINAYLSMILVFAIVAMTRLAAPKLLSAPARPGGKFLHIHQLKQTQLAQCVIEEKIDV
jgi:hypothetical protein